MRLMRISRSFDHRDFLFEPKIDGFRAVPYEEELDHEPKKSSG
jgi:hypothetical protein